MENEKEFKEFAMKKLNISSEVYDELVEPRMKEIEVTGELDSIKKISYLTAGLTNIMDDLILKHNADRKVTLACTFSNIINHYDISMSDWIEIYKKVQ